MSQPKACRPSSFIAKVFSFQLFSAKPFTASEVRSLLVNALPCGEFPLNFSLLFNLPNLKGSWQPREVQRAPGWVQGWRSNPSSTPFQLRDLGRCKPHLWSLVSL